MTGARQDVRRTSLALAAVTSLFFAWGFITSNNDPLIVTLRAAFDLSYSEALLTQIVSFLANGLLSLPAAWLCSRIGSVDTILGSLALMVAGCLAVVLSTDANSFLPILAALFVLAAGFTGLQVAANPLAAELGIAAAQPLPAELRAGLQLARGRARGPFRLARHARRPVARAASRPVRSSLAEPRSSRRSIAPI